VVGRLGGPDLEAAQRGSVQRPRQAGGSCGSPVDQYSTARAILPSASSKNELA
jgi:hypothetical protein